MGKPRRVFKVVKARMVGSALVVGCPAEIANAIGLQSGDMVVLAAVEGTRSYRVTSLAEEEDGPPGPSSLKDYI